MLRIDAVRRPRTGRRRRTWAVTGRAAAAFVIPIGALAIGAAPAAHAAGGAPSRAALASAGPVHTAGTRIVDGYGRTVLVHGVNNVDKGNDDQGRREDRPAVVPGDGHTLDSDDAALLAGYGINAVRLGVSFANLMPQEDRIDTAYIDRLVTVVDMLAAHGIRTLLDDHQDGLGPQWGGNGFSEWAIDARPAPGEPNPGFPLYYLMPSMNAGWDEVWNNDHGVLDRLGDALGALAGALEGHPGAMGIELINEPWPGTAAVTCFPAGCPGFDARYQRAMQSLTDAIRARNPALPVFWEPNVTWNQLMPSFLGAETPIDDANVVFAPHDYCIPSQSAIYLLHAPGALDGLCDVQQAHTWRQIDAVQERTGLPTVVTEFGDNDAAVLPNTLRRADEHFTGWFYWHYAPQSAGRARPDPFASPTPPDEQAPEASLAAPPQTPGTGLSRQLVRTYPQATSGTPVSLHFDPDTGDFSYTYDPGPAAQDPGPAGETVIYTSSVHYPDGYRAHADGAALTSPDGARLLTVRADGDGPVTVTVTARD